jgi:RNA polymerase sigma-70 factor (ECF subfamily)
MTLEDHTAPPPPDSDVMLVQRTLAGEQRAFEMLVVKYQRRVERLIGRMVRDTDLVQDIAQETFIRAYRALASSTPTTTPLTTRRLPAWNHRDPPSCAR